MNGQTINVICFDVNGIFNPAETKMKSENVLLQETHLTPSEHERTLKEWVFRGCTTHLINQATATLISQQIPFEQVSEIRSSLRENT